MDDKFLVKGGWPKGMNSLFPPEDILDSQLSYAENVTNRGGVVQTRPGQDLLYSLPGKILQGFAIFTPNNSRPSMVAAVDGKIYVSKPPFTTFSIVSELSFDAAAKQIVIEPCLQSVKRVSSGNLELIEPIRLVIIQDGHNRPGYYDGTTARHLQPLAPNLETPVGLWMEWTSSRLWVSNGHRVYASDIADPTSFTETTYLAERSSFELPGNCTGMIETPSQRGLLVFTRTSTTGIQSNIRNRPDWLITPDFQKLILPGIGCESGFSPINAYGLTYWMTSEGLTNLDAAFSSLHASRMTVVDGEMTRSKAKMAHDISGAATGFFANMLLVSTPIGSRYNTQTWVLDQSAAGEDDVPLQAWAGVWSGTRPVKWASAYVDGRQRCFYASHDATARDGTHLHIWEAFRQSREDRGSRIPCQMETNAFTFNAQLREVKYLEMELGEIYGTVNVSAYVGGRKGQWIPMIDNVSLKANIGCITPGFRFTKTSLVRNFKRQTRTLRSKEFASLGINLCSPEIGVDREGQDKTFTVLVNWRGQMGVHNIRFSTGDGEERKGGKCPGDESGESNIVLESGEVLSDD